MLVENGMYSYLWRFRNIAKIFTRRLLESRYRSSTFGAYWAVLQPLLLFSLYTTAFSVMSKGLGLDVQHHREQIFSTLLGLSVFFLFSEVLNNSPYSVISNQNLVKKVVFPLEVLPLSNVILALVSCGISLAIIGIGAFSLGLVHSWTILTIPLLLIPYVAFLAGLAWIISAVSVFVRDVAILIPFLTTMLMFSSPIFFDGSRVPAEFRYLLAYNPIAVAIEVVRNAAIGGTMPQASSYLIVLVVTLLWCHFGFWFFQRAKISFADAL